MIPKADYHVHTAFCDGSASPAAMAEAALGQGLSVLGFSGHSRTAFDESWCMTAEGTARYRAEIRQLQAAYAGRLRILCGIEQDFCSEEPTDDYDYVIGSVHYLPFGGEHLPVDESPAHLRAAAERHFGGDLLRFAEVYYETVSQVAEKTGCGLIGHFDLIAKFNEGGRLFNEADPRYVEAWQTAADRLLTGGVPFEINTGAIFRGYRTAPYPSLPIVRYLAERGARFVLSGDAHAPDGLCFDFVRRRREAEAVGAVFLPEPVMK